MSREFFVDHIIEKEDLIKGTFIVLVNAHATPPHIATIEDGVFLSLEYDGLKLRSLEEFLRFVELKKLPVFAIKLKESAKANFQINYKEWEAIRRGETCIAPILKSLERTLNANHQSILTVLEELEERNLITENYGINLLLDANNKYVFPSYSQKEIFDRIEKLNASKKSEPHT